MHMQNLKIKKHLIYSIQPALRQEAETEGHNQYWIMTTIEDYLITKSEFHKVNMLVVVIAGFPPINFIILLSFYGTCGHGREVLN